jgi:hypothetical protein
MAMNPIIHKFLAVLSACAMAASILSYMYSFFGAPVDKILLWGFLLLIPGWIALFLPMYVLEYPLSRAPSFSWKGFARGMPSWVAPCSWLLSVIFVAHLVWLAVQNGWGVPEIVNGQYVLSSRGRILKLLTQAEYLALTEAELRAFTTAMISLYFVPMVYWWFRRTHRQDLSTSG